MKKNFLYLFTPSIILVLFACSIKDKPQFIPIEYYYSFEKIGKGKTFIYNEENGARRTFIKDIILVIEADKKYLIYQNYSSNQKGDSSKFTIDYHLVETFLFMSPEESKNLDFPTKVKGSIIKDSVITNGRRIGTRVSKISYEGNQDIFAINTKEEYLKDTVLIWRGKPLAGIVTQKKSIVGFTVKDNSRDIQNKEIISNCYYAKGIGLLFFTQRTKEFSSKFNLIEIKDLKRVQ